LGDFKISYFKMGPTELRLLLSIGNLALLWKSTVHLFGRSYRLFNVGATIGISGMLLILLISVIQHTLRLYRGEPLPKPSKPSAEIQTSDSRQPVTRVLRGVFGLNQR
jgi:hypothetical protein